METFTSQIASLPLDELEVRRLTEQLARNALAIAELLSKPRYDEARLAELDVRAGQLRASIAARLRPVNGVDDEPPAELLWGGGGMHRGLACGG